MTFFKRTIIFLGISGLLFGALFVAAGAYLMITPLDPKASEAKTIQVIKGMSPRQISQLLEEARVIENADLFQQMGRFTRQWPRIKAGEYDVSAAQSPREIFEILTSGISKIHIVTIQEGKNYYEVANELESKGLARKKQILALCRNPKFIRQLGFKDPLPDTLEGYLYPDTYHFNRTLTAKDLLSQMVRRFQMEWTEEFQTRAQQLGLSQHQVVTLASIIEKETGAPEERPLIGSVFHNRLQKKMRLQSDPTTIYGIWERYTGNLKREHLLEKTPFNTYAVPGLPIGPISNPGKEALHAALFPAKSDYFYFVSKNDGTHRFSRTLEEHNRAVHQHQVNPEARKGKSWRDLSKRSGNKQPSKSP